MGASNFDSGVEAKNEVERLVKRLGEIGVKATTIIEDSSDPKPQKKKHPD